ncbi:ABC transporter permease subunit [Microbacterium sp. No. 7]|uniref:ABC transporter permease subunit n=1 Tax=Microbacterium sp. No. 7 TaxID=1714373 RepID=UPI0009E7D8B6|nr:ABC transporter permease subunit [Microbacterium sp. No. 7]
MSGARPWRALSGPAIVGASRVAAVAGVVVLVGMMPWLSGRSAEYTVLRARYADLEVTPEALAAVREELGLDRGAWALFLDWLGALLLRGDAGRSWINGRPVLPGMVDALGVSLTLMAFAITVALVVAVLVAAPALRAGLRGAPARGSGAAAVALTALPEFLLASVLLVVGAVWLGLFPPYGWKGPLYAVLPALALGLPAGGLIGRLTVDAVTATFSERWIMTWRLAGFGDRRIGLAVIRRALPSILGQIGLALIGLTGGAVAVEQVFAIPGLGRATLGAAASQDIPALQVGILLLLLLAVVTGVVVAALRWALLGPALRLGSLPVPAPQVRRRRRDVVVPVASGAVLVLIVAAGLLRDPFAAVHGRLAPPGPELPFGADALGRDLLARVGHGAVTTLGTAVFVVLVCLAIGLVLGCFPRAVTGPLEVTNAAPPIIAGLIVAAIAGPSIGGAAVAVALVSWAPLAAHTAALVVEARAQPHIVLLPVLGVGRARVMLRHVLPAVVGPVSRHAVLRLPGIALALAALGFLGLGPHQPTPEWGLVLAEGMGYVERAPWTVLAPAFALVLASIMAVSLASLPLRGAARGQRRADGLPNSSKKAGVAPDGPGTGTDITESEESGTLARPQP